MREIALVAHNLRSIHNVGSILRSCDGFGVQRVFCTGYTPYPSLPNDTRLPHIRTKITRQLHKTALGAEETIDIRHEDDIQTALTALRADGYTIAALEQSKNSVALSEYTPPYKIALIVGREVEGIEPDIMKETDLHLEIPMRGTKESFNVSVAAAIALYHCRFLS
ncbi:TrmH family RNA methyltransferase [Patescibacteria group bacterium]|nr:MAG: TrmH family RNA methyltransferase [Patescibacteria group bacterium]